VKLVALILVVVSSTIATAQPKDNRQRDAGYIGKDVELLEIDDCPAPPPAMGAEELHKVAGEHYQRGLTLYLQGDYAAAVTEFIDAYCLKPEFYTILKDIGQALERDLAYERAIGYYERFVQRVPPDAKRLSQCDPDPQIDKDNVASRVGVLSKLRAQVFVETDPKDAKVTISNKDSGVAATGVSGTQIDVFGGKYTMLIEKPGFEPVSRPLDTKIGKPHTVFAHLEPVKGRLSIQVTPPDARMYLDTNFVGIGRYQNPRINAGTYELSLESPGHDNQIRRVVVLPDKETKIQAELFPKPQTGRRQAIIFATVAGAAAAGSISNAFDEVGLEGVTGTALAGAVAGFVGSYFFMPDDIALGTSSLAITSTIAGYLAGSTAAALLTTDDKVITPAGGATALVAAAVGYYVGEKAAIRPGDAALINSGVIWGAATGSLFAASFAANDSSTRVSAGLTLTGLGMGTLGGVMMTRYFQISRSHAALIDLGGIVGIIAGIATQQLAYPDQTNTDEANEHRANFAIGGLAVGLLGAGILTRNYDTPQIPVSPSFGQARNPDGSSSLTYGFSGSW